MKNKILLVLLFIFILGGFLRFYKLTEYPIQLNHDEVSQAYDAISIATTGKDIYGNFLPTMFKSINDYKSPFYTYITAITYLFFGWTELTIKLPGAIFGTLVILAVFVFTLKIFKNWKISLFAALLTAISPLEIFISRKSFENEIGLFFLLAGFSFLYIFLQEGKKLLSFYMGIILLIVGMYTYFSHAIIIPFLLLIFLIIYRQDIFKQSPKYYYPLILGLLLAIPLFLIVLTNPQARYRSQTVFITQDVKLQEQISYLGDSNSILSKILSLKVIIDYIFTRYLNQFDPNYIFGKGLDLTNQGPINMGLLFFIQLPFALIGLWQIIKRAGFSKEKLFIFSWIIIGMIPSGLTFEVFSPHRTIMVFTMLNIISACGIVIFTEFITKLNSLLKNIFAITTVLLFSLNFIYFTHLYTVDFPYEKSQHIHYPFKEISLFAWSKHGEFDKIIVDPIFGEAAPVGAVAVHYYLAYYGKYPPVEFQRGYKIDKLGLTFDKFDIRRVNWEIDKKLKRALIIASPWDLPVEKIDKNKIIKTFYFYDHRPAYYAVETYE